MSAAATELPMPESDSPGRNSGQGSRFSDLRSVRWRIDLGILPSSPAASIEELRRVAADSRRRYASLRRCLLIDPHLPKDGHKSPDLTMDNPLSQNPDSIWGRFFQNAELEKTLDQDLSRLYPEHGSYFQTPACQALLRRILLLWCIRHPEYGYRQGMHELLAPLLYVLNVDLQHLSHVRGLYEDFFNDEFDGMSFSEGDLVSNYRFTKATEWDSGTNNDNSFQERTPKVGSLDALDPDTRDIFFLSDAYGAEGELGVILSERFMEHDAYCMFDGLMSGARGVVSMADFFSPSPVIGSSTGLPPVIEASSALYHLLSIVDSSLHTHLVELGVEPQYFALRWLRVLFGREFSLDNLLVVWDELFSSSNSSVVENDAEYSFKVLCSPRGALISALAVSMLLHLRSSLLATEHTTSCLQRLLNFPKNINVNKLIEKAKSYQALALESNISSSPSQENSKQELNRAPGLPTGFSSPKTPNRPDSYWEEKWRVLHKEEALKKGGGSISSGKLKGLLKERLGLSRTESDPTPTKKDGRSNVRRRLLDDLAREIESEAVAIDKLVSDGLPQLSHGSETHPLEVDGGENAGEDNMGRTLSCKAEETCLSEEREQTCLGEEREETCLSGENSSVFSVATSPESIGNEHDNDSDKSSVTSNSFIADNDEETNPVAELRDSDATSSTSAKEVGPNEDSEVKQGVGLKDRKPLSGKFQWLWKLGRGSGEGNLEKASSSVGNACKENLGTSTSDHISSGDSGRIEVGDKKVMGTLKNLGQSMLENIQVIESVFQQDRGQAGNILGGKGQASAMAALKELRKISNLLSEM